MDEGEGPPADGAAATPPVTEPDTAPKRARIDPTVATDADNRSKTPLQVAEDYMKSHIESLHEGLATLLLELARKHLQLSHRISLKTANIRRMEKDEDYIPGSARVKFSLSIVKEAGELPEFLELKQDCEDYVKEIHQGLKKRIIKCAKLERKTLLAEKN